MYIDLGEYIMEMFCMKVVEEKGFIVCGNLCLGGLILIWGLEIVRLDIMINIYFKEGVYVLVGLKLVYKDEFDG